ncbi:glycosyltransferase family 9 protein [Leptotrichia sp. HSP-342]|uniref:Glycosyltransferase family 9 protein n=1 Tax=Leptotrichia mesophila TaxID=3239303 RepID=A0AB39VAD9_9FUSO
MSIINSIKSKIIIWLFGTKKKHKDINLKNIRTILLNPKDSIGDTLMSFSYARQLRKIYPDIKLGMVVTDRNIEFAKLSNENEHIIDVIVNRKDVLRNSKKWDVLLDFLSKENTKRMIWKKILNPKITIIFGENYEGHHYNKEILKNYDFDCTPPMETHIIDYLIDSEFSKYFKIEKQKPHIELLQQDIDKMEEFWNSSLENSYKKVKILLVPQGSDREMNPGEVSQLLNNISEEKMKKVKIIMGNTNGSDEYFKKLKPLVNKKLDISLSPQFDIRKYVLFMATSDIVVGVDGGGIHIATSLNKPLLSFYANNKYNLCRWSPKTTADSLQTISRTAGNHNQTYNFSLSKPIQWLNTQIEKISETK